MPQIDLQLGGGYTYQWECAVLLALNYLFDTPLEYNSELHDLICEFLGQVEAIHLEGETREQGAVDLEDINLLNADRAICIQVKAKEAEGDRWVPSDLLLTKALYRFYRNQALDQDEPPIRFVFLSNRSFNPDLVRLKAAIAAGAVAQSKQADHLFNQVQRYVNKDQPTVPPPARLRFNRLLSRLALIEFLSIDEVKANIQAKLQALGVESWQQAYEHFYTRFSKASIRRGGTRITRGDLLASLDRFSEELLRLRVPPVALYQLPPDIADFTGRREELTRVTSLLEQAAKAEGMAVVISAVAGMPGIGKSALAVHVAHRLKDHFPDAQLYVNLRGAEGQPLDPFDVLAGLLRALGVEDRFIPEDLRERAGVYRSRMADKRALVLLDNAHDEAQVRPLLPGSPTCAVLVTSRKSLSALEGATILDLEVMLKDEARELLGRLIGTERVKAEDEAERIIRLCGQLPLALRIAGGKLRDKPHWSLENYASQLADERRRLERLQLGDLDVRASLALSYQDLAPDDARLFRLLGLLAGSDFAPQVAAVLLRAELDAVWEALERLVDLQLLESAGEGRYRFHDLIHLFAREQLEEEEPLGVRMTAQLRIAQWYRDALEMMERWLQPETRRKETRMLMAQMEQPLRELERIVLLEALDWFEKERANLLGVLEWAYDAEEWKLSWQLAASLVGFSGILGYWADWQRAQELALKAVRNMGDRSGEGYTLMSLGSVYRLQGHWTAAIQTFETSLSIFRELGDRHGESRVLNNLGNAYFQQGHWSEASQMYQDALGVAREMGDRYNEGQLLGNLGGVYAQQGFSTEAFRMYEDSLHIKRELGDHHGEAQTLNNIGALYTDQHHLSRAMQMYEEALSIFRELGDHHGEGKTLANMGNCYHQQGNNEKSLALWQEAKAKLHPDSPEHKQVAEYLLIVDSMRGREMFLYVSQSIEMSQREELHELLQTIERSRPKTTWFSNGLISILEELQTIERSRPKTTSYLSPSLEAIERIRLEIASYSSPSFPREKSQVVSGQPQRSAGVPLQDEHDDVGDIYRLRSPSTPRWKKGKRGFEHRQSIKGKSVHRRKKKKRGYYSGSS